MQYHQGKSTCGKVLRENITQDNVRKITFCACFYATLCVFLAYIEVFSFFFLNYTFRKSKYLHNLRYTPFLFWLWVFSNCVVEWSFLLSFILNEGKEIMKNIFKRKIEEKYLWKIVRKDIKHKLIFNRLCSFF